jgi:hypothetical protein
MNTTKTVSAVLAELQQAKEAAGNELYHMILCTLKEPFLSDFLIKLRDKKTLIQKIVHQIMSEQKIDVYCMPADFLINLSEEKIAVWNQENEIFKIFMKDPTSEYRQVTVTLK